MDPRVVAALAALERDNGRLMPQDVVNAARNRRSPLNPFFEWDDSVAAQRYRLQQASLLIRRVRVEVTVNQVPYRAPQYLLDPAADTDGERRGYQRLDVIRQHDDNSRAALVSEMQRVAQAVRRAKTVAVALGFVAEVEAIDDLAALVIKRTSINDQPGGSA